MKKNNSLDLLRILAIIMVLIVHLGQVLFEEDSFIRNITNKGDRGVPIFFALSGFLIMTSLTYSKSLKEFYVKRFFRIVPAYYAMLVICMFIMTMPADDYGLGWWRYFLFINETVPAKPLVWGQVNGYWCLPSFMIFYLISPLVHKYCKTIQGGGNIGNVFLSYRERYNVCLSVHVLSY